MARAKFLCDAERCIECNACVTACKNEHEVPWGINRRKVVTIQDGQPGERSISVACMHCSDAPCMAVCPVDCFYQTDDGIVLHSKDLCIGCGYCFYACPFGAPQYPQAGNFGSRGKMDKCTFCAHRLDAGLLPACVETCVGEARVIGDLNDPHSQISQLLATNKTDIKVLKPTANTSPRVFYIGMSSAFEHKISGQAPVRTLLTDTGEEIHHGH